MTDVQRTLYAFGLGYSAERLAHALIPRNWRIRGSVRSQSRADALARLGMQADVWPGPGHTAPVPPHGAHWLISIPPDEWGCPAFLGAGHLAASASSITYLSTTGIYGDMAGGWVTETTPPNPGSARAHARLLAEQQWRSVRGDLNIVRLPGIYGPGRSAFDRIRNGSARRIVKPGQVFSRVHVDDIASGLIALFRRPIPGGTFHLTDDAPAPPQDVIAHAAALLGLSPPPEIDFEAADLSPMARSFYAECKRVSNAHTKAVLRWRPAYPTYQAGLAAILAEETAD